MTDTPNADCESPRRGAGFFFWKPQWFYSWPIKLVRGHDEYRRSTAGMVTWAGSIFFAWPHDDPNCLCADEPNDPYADAGRKDNDG